MDVSNKVQVNDGVESAIKEFGRIDILVNCEGIIISYLLRELEEDDWNKVMDVNTKGVFLVSQTAVKGMVKKRRENNKYFILGGENRGDRKWCILCIKSCC